MKEEIKVLYKRPGKNIQEVKIPNELHWLQGGVEGPIEAVHLRPDLVMLVNEEGKLRGMQHNFYMAFDNIVGPVLFVGVDGEDFTDCPLSKWDILEWMMGMNDLQEGGKRDAEKRPDGNRP